MKCELIDHMGTDLTVVNAARVSFDKESEWYQDDYGEHLKNQDEKLISYLAKNGHWTPFAHCTVTIRETVPIFVARQRFKHMVGFVYNEVSRRYVNDEPEFFIPKVWRGKPTNAKQGSEGVINQPWISIEYQAVIEACRECYIAMLEDGVAPEQARMVLPQSMYTSYYCTGSLYAWARAYKLRSDNHAQLEIQQLAQQWNDIIKPIYPYSWSALTNV